MGQYFCLPEATPVHDDDAQAQLVDSGDDPSAVANRQESQLPGGGKDAGATDAGVGHSAGGAAGTVAAAGDASQSEDAAAHAADGTATSAASSKRKKSMRATGTSAERQATASKHKEAVGADCISGEPVAEFATPTKMADDSGPAKKVASTADVHKATALRRNRKGDAPRSGATGKQELRGGKPDKYEVAKLVSGTAVKGTDVVGRPSSASDSSASRVSRTEVRTPPTSDSAASLASTQPPGVRAGTHVPAASATSPSTSPPPPPGDEEEQEAERREWHDARFRDVVRRMWRHTAAVCCVLLLLAVAIASVAFKTSDELSHLFMMLDLDRHTPAPGAGNTSEPPPPWPGNETIINELKPDQLLLDGIRGQRRFRDQRD
ncbi:myristoylated alanine-rich C-kinase substrate-like [Dermacentor albipictus]|uniref:myristoylated alanine-rich C-kinase substrate-like n=1 Tax=Dermacentor albipictus TaxID=60249 RepID=UPI0031FC82BF